MSLHQATIEWQLADPSEFTQQRYSRVHRWVFDGGANGAIEVLASASPAVVPLPQSSADAIDPEEAFVASLSSCHMLWFLSIVAARGLVVTHYKDTAVGTLGKGATGKMMITDVALTPVVRFSAATAPTAEQHAALHHRAHEQCFLAQSVQSTITCNATLEVAYV